MISKKKFENVEPGALKEWKINIFKINDTQISFYSRKTHLLPLKPKSSFQHLKRCIKEPRNVASVSEVLALLSWSSEGYI